MMALATILALSALLDMMLCKFWRFCRENRVRKMAPMVRMTSITAVMTFALVLMKDKGLCDDVKRRDGEVLA
jgi:hypothetical protein